MKFSIVIPTFNGERHISRTIESAINQTRTADEIIISDDNSTDSTLEICRKYEPTVKVTVNPGGPSGFVKGWQRAIEKASGEYISILHQDDLLYREFLEEIERTVNDFPEVGHIFAVCDTIDEQGNIIRHAHEETAGDRIIYRKSEYPEAYEKETTHIHRCPGVITRKDIFKVCNYREEAGHIADDDFFLRVANYTDVVGIMKPLAAYREHSGSETGRLSDLSLNLRLMNDYHYQLGHSDENPLLTPTLIELFKKRECTALHRVIAGGIRTGRFSAALKGLRRWLQFDSRFGNVRFDLTSRLKGKQ